MAKQNLPVNYKDDVMSSSMGAKRRWQITQNTDGTYNIEDVTTYDQVGSEFGAGDINLTNQAVNQSADAGKIIDDPDTAEATTEEGYIAGVQLFNHVTDSLGGLQFGYDSASEKYGYWKKEAGTDVFVPFSQGEFIDTSITGQINVPSAGSYIVVADYGMLYGTFQTETLTGANIEKKTLLKRTGNTSTTREFYSASCVYLIECIANGVITFAPNATNVGELKSMVTLIKV